ncbi:hypothetical protein Amsp01_042490 [Amycolatopsis sp. NBRC 101858]|uniref:hypothetical protein n=1 Tax=Amycolatopsis sp. NBRC 101858 TaxID=3032200 RepID=UPI00249F9B46|nr:hypothetical protein [Amycolatopsis sp. NBRC 101858]GLY38225.1 hypothetical protein Amsp01_042490 [Amycolatopsis sp. NBRC 101858]
MLLDARTGVAVTSGSPAPAEKLVADPLAYVRPALRVTGDLDEVRRAALETQ